MGRDPCVGYASVVIGLLNSSKNWIAALGQADLGRGRVVFDRVCASCHKLYGVGGEIGPDLTGAGRDNLDYLLENIIDPSATVSADFRMMVVAMRDGRVLNGLVKAESPRTVTLQTQTEPVVLDRSEIESLRLSPSSLMPDGLLDTLSKAEVGDLIAYLAHPTQVALPREPVIVEEVNFRNGSDILSGSLYRPGGTGPYPAIVMILGSEGHDRDYGGVGPALGRHFARSGFACLSWDRPGIGRSAGDYNKQTFRDRADEALAAVWLLRERKEIRRDQIGVWGHSQGGMIAPLAASLSDNVAFLIEVSGWQGPAWKQDPARVEAELRAAGFPEADVGQAVAFARKRMEMIRGTGPYSDLEAAQNAVKALPWFRSVHLCDRVRFEAARGIVGNDSTDWWSRVRCPVLVLYGGRDVSTGPPEPLIAIIRRGLAVARNDDVTVRVFPDADHSLCRVPAGTRSGEGARAKRTAQGSRPGFCAWLPRDHDGLAGQENERLEQGSMTKRPNRNSQFRDEAPVSMANAYPIRQGTSNWRHSRDRPHHRLVSVFHQVGGASRFGTACFVGRAFRDDNLRSALSSLRTLSTCCGPKNSVIASSPYSVWTCACNYFPSRKTSTELFAK